MDTATAYMLAWWAVSGAGGALFAKGNVEKDIFSLLAGACLTAAGILGNMV